MRSRERVEQAFDEFERVLDESGRDRFDLVIVFGSYARGYPKEDSDFDVYLVTDDLAEERVSTSDPSTVGLHWTDDLPDPDIIAATPLEFTKRCHDDDERFIETVIEEGTYVQGWPRDVRQAVDYDPIEDSD